jgi:hypothetical protein
MPLLGIALLLTVGSGVGVLPAVAAASPGLPAAVAPVAAPLTGKEYVALGDSFTADWGVDPVAADQPSSGCRQSTNDYPHQVAANLGLDLTDVSCAGALTTNMTQPQTSFPDGLSHPPAPPQFDALTATTEIVTIGIGGNDFGFGDIAGSCAVNPVTGYVFGAGWPSYYTTCKDYYDPGGTPANDTLRQRISSVVVPAVQQTITAIRARSPKAAVFFVDYLALAPDQAHAPNPATYPDSCYESLFHSQSFPFGGVDTEYIAGLQALFNQSVDATATAAGATVVSTYAKSLSHSPCYGTADPWVNGITTALTSSATPTGTPPPSVGPPSPTATPPGSPLDSRLGSSDVAVGSLHPNLEGAIQQSQSVTFTILQTLTGTTVGTPPPTTVTTTATTTATVTETVTSTVTSTATPGSSSSTAAPASSSPALGSSGRTDPPAAAARAGLATTGSSSGMVVLAGVALVVLGLVVLLLRRGIRHPQRR